MPDCYFMVPFTKTFHRLRVIGLTSLIVVSVVLFGCKSDKDGDRVEDAKDECDNARGVAVDANGCPCADSAALPEPLPIAAVRMYVDNSGSMRDFTNPTSLFRSTISECISRIQKMKTDNIADTVRYHLIASSLLHTDYNILYKAIRTGDIMKAKSTPILSMIEQVQRRHEAQDISVLVSDFELSEKDADNLDLALKTDVLAQIAKHNAVGLYAFREKSVDRPYYVMVIGTSASVLLFDREGGLRDYRHKIFLGVKYPVPEIAFLNYSQRDETTWFISQDFCRTIEDASLAGKGYIQFAMGLDLKKYEGLQLDSVYLTKNTLIKDVDPPHVAMRWYTAHQFKNLADEKEAEQLSTYSHVVVVKLHRLFENTNKYFFELAKAQDFERFYGSDPSMQALVHGFREAYRGDTGPYFSVKLNIVKEQ